ncbi:hypothetical protein Tco_0098413 [Tanacetum coccineum]
MVKSWLVQDQTVLGKDYSNLLIADSLLKTIWFINAPCYGNEALASPKVNGINNDGSTYFKTRVEFRHSADSSSNNPFTTQPSSSRSQKKQSRRKQRKDIAVTQEETQQDDSVPTPSNDLPISGEDSMQLSELMLLCTNLHKQVLDLEKAKDAQAKEIVSLKKRRVESFKDKETLGNHEDASKQGRRIEYIDKDADVSLVDDTQGRSQVNSELYKESQPLITKDKGKAIMIEPEVPLKRKDQVPLDEDLARNLQA